MRDRTSRVVLSLGAVKEYGPLVAMQAVIPSMREQHSVTIVTINPEVIKVVFPGSKPTRQQAASIMIPLTARKELAADDAIAAKISIILNASSGPRHQERVTSEARD